jgi:hypothetical protein
MIRLLQLFKNDRISEEEWSEFTALPIEQAKHDCNANTWTVFERNELRVRALRDIPADTELTEQYNVPKLGDDELHKTTLSAKWNIQCNCNAPGGKGPIGPTGELKARVTKLESDTLDMDSIHEQRKVERAIEDMKKAGFGYSTRSMETLHGLAAKGQLCNTNTAEALKICLKIYYLILPAGNPKPVLQRRITVFFAIVSLLHHNKLDDEPESNPGVKALQPLPQKVMDLLTNILFHLKAKLVSDTTKCFGEDSMASRLEKASFEVIFTSLRLFVPTLRNYVPLRESQEERDKFLKGMNGLMKWADLPAQSLEQLLF